MKPELSIDHTRLWEELRAVWWIKDNNNTFIDKENQYDANVSVIEIKGSLWYQRIFIIKNA